MGAKRFRNFSVYVQGKRWGTAKSATLEVSEEGGEDFFEKGEWIGASTGVVRATLSLDSFVPTGGIKEQQLVLEALLAGRYLDITCGEIGARFMKFRQMKPKSVRWESDAARGGLILQTTLSSGAPDVQKSTRELPLRLALF